MVGREVETLIIIYQRVHDFRHLQIGDNDFLVSYDVTALFTNVPVEETIQILAKKAFNGDWFNNTHNLNICEGDLIELLTIATKDQLFQFNGDLYKQIDDVAMDSPLGPLMANIFMCSIEEKLAQENKLPNFYKRYVDDTFALVPDLTAATDFLSVRTQRSNLQWKQLSTTAYLS